MAQETRKRFGVWGFDTCSVEEIEMDLRPRVLMSMVRKVMEDRRALGMRRQLAWMRFKTLHKTQTSTDTCMG